MSCALRIMPGDDLEVRVPRAGKIYRIAGLSSSEGSVNQNFMGNDEERFI